MSLSSNVSEKAALIWAIADKLTGVYKPHEYGEVILPLTVIRRFDCILADTKDTVLEKFESVKNLSIHVIVVWKLFLILSVCRGYRKCRTWQFHRSSLFLH